MASSDVGAYSIKRMQYSNENEFNLYLCELDDIDSITEMIVSG